MMLSARPTGRMLPPTAWPNCFRPTPGFLLEKELRVLGNLLDNAQHPFAALLGGAKVSDKIKLISNMLGKIDMLLIGGGMAATFLKARGYSVGISAVEEDKIALANDLAAKAAAGNVELVLPPDVIVADAINDLAKYAIAPVDHDTSQ